MKIEDKIKAIELYEVYKKLLSTKQCEIFEYYYFDDMSIIEIAQDLEISKNAVFKSLKTINEKTENYEMKLEIIKNKKENIKILSENNVNEKIINLIK